jgi:hypothetical protein
MNVLNQPSPLEAQRQGARRNGVLMRVNVAGGWTAGRRIFGGMAGLQLVDLRSAARAGPPLAQQVDKLGDADRDSCVRTRKRAQPMPARVARA